MAVLPLLFQIRYHSPNTTTSIHNYTQLWTCEDTEWRTISNGGFQLINLNVGTKQNEDWVGNSNGSESKEAVWGWNQCNPMYTGEFRTMMGTDEVI